MGPKLLSRSKANGTIYKESIIWEANALHCSNPIRACKINPILYGVDPTCLYTLLQSVFLLKILYAVVVHSNIYGIQD